MESNYLTPKDLNAFQDHVKRTPLDENWVECPQCFGYGGWNLLLNQYMRQEGKERHFRCFCSQCGGRGFVHKDGPNVNCIHEWVQDKKLGNCYNQHKCSNCGTTKKVDSSG